MKKLVTNEDGQVMILFALVLVVLMGFAALTVDVGSMTLTKTKLQTAADAAALAGAQDLKNANYDNTVISYAKLNGVPETDISVNPTNTDPMKLEVVCTRNVKHTFARVLGFTDTTLMARAVVSVSAVKSVSGAVPLGLEDQTLVYGETYLLKENAGAGQYHGNFGGLALGGNGANNFRNNFKYGYDGVLTVGEKVDTEPGNMAGPTIDGINYRISQDPAATFETVQKGSARICVVPVVDTMDVNGRKEVTIVGFAVFFLESVVNEGHGNGNNAEAAVYGKFMEMMVGNSTGGAETSYGAYKLQLIE